MHCPYCGRELPSGRVESTAAATGAPAIPLLHYMTAEESRRKGFRALLTRKYRSLETVSAHAYCCEHCGKVFAEFDLHRQTGNAK